MTALYYYLYLYLCLWLIDAINIVIVIILRSSLLSFHIGQSLGTSSQVMHSILAKFAYINSSRLFLDCQFFIHILKLLTDHPRCAVGPFQTSASALLPFNCTCACFSIVNDFLGNGVFYLYDVFQALRPVGLCWLLLILLMLELLPCLVWTYTIYKKFDYIYYIIFGWNRLKPKTSVMHLDKKDH